MINQPALDELRVFIDRPTAENASRLVGIPALLHVLELGTVPFFQDVLGICRWLHDRCTQVMTEICKSGAYEDPVELTPLETEDWRVVCVWMILRRLRLTSSPRLAVATACPKFAIVRSIQSSGTMLSRNQRKS
jgi:hypothetical protein